MPTKVSQSQKTTSKSKSAKASPKSCKSAKAVENTADLEVTIDRRRSDRGDETSTAPAKIERRTKVQRRRQIDPTTCERDYSEEEVSFMSALDEYKRKSGRMFPTCSEVLEVIRGLGYVQLTPAELALVRPEGQQVSDTLTPGASETLDSEEAWEPETV